MDALLLPHPGMVRVSVQLPGTVVLGGVDAANRGFEFLTRSPAPADIKCTYLLAS